MTSQGIKRPFSWKRLKNQVMDVVGNPFNVIVIVSLLILFYLIIVPLGQMIINTVTLAARDVPRVEGGQMGDFTLYYWKRVFASMMSSAVLWEPLKHSLLLGVCTSVIAVPLGSVMAWLIVRSDIPGKKFLTMGVIVPYMIPSWCKAMAWLSVFRNGSSGSVGFLEGLGVTIPDWLAYGPVAMISVMVLHYYAFSYIMVSSSLRSINSELEEMGEIQGANRRQILSKITLPLVLPAVLSATIMTLSKSLGTYGVAANLGMRIQYFTLSTRMKESLGTQSPAVGYVLAILLIVLASGTIFANQRLIGTRKSYETLGGKGTKHTPIPLGKSKVIVLIFVGIFLLTAMVGPIFFLVMETFQKSTGGGYGLNNLTLYNWVGEASATGADYPGIFRNPDFLNGIKNTVLLTIVSALLTALSGQFLGYISSRGRGKWYGRLTEQLVFVPYLMPGIAFSAIYLGMWSQPRLFGIIPSLYGTFAILVLVSVVKHFPFASRAGTANMLQISVELEEAASIAGASFWRRMFKIVTPLAKQGFISGFMLVFISIAKELDLIILVMSPKYRTLSYIAFEYSRAAVPQMASAISVCVLVFVLVSYYIAHKVFGADIGKSWG